VVVSLTLVVLVALVLVLALWQVLLAHLGQQ
jgi:hypothetical protein